MTTVFRNFVEQLGGSDATTFVGSAGEIFYDPTTTTLRISDGSTPGGVIINTGGGGSSQTISWDSGTNTLSISGGNSADLSSLSGQNTDSQTLSIAGTDLTISNGNTVDLSAFLQTANLDTELATATTITELQDGSGWNLPGPYTNESSAASAGIAIGQAYYDNGGTVRVRLT